MTNYRKNEFILVLGILSGVILLISNLAATKIFSFLGVPMDAGILIYPFTYIIGDLLMIVSDDDRRPRMIIWTGFAANLLAAVVMLIAVKLPVYPGWNNQEAFEAIFTFAPRVILGSLVAYVASSLINIIAFRRIAEQKSDYLFTKAFGSSAIAKVFDVVVFELIAFAGVLPAKDFFLQILFAYGAGMLLEFPLSALACLIAKGMIKKEEKALERQRKQVIQKQ